MNKLSRERDLILTLALLPLLIGATSFSCTLLVCAIAVAIYASALITKMFASDLNTSSQNLLMTILVVAAAVGLIDLCLHAFAWNAWASLGAYLPLVAITIVLVVSNKDAQRPSWATIGKIMATVIGFGALRELIGTGALFSQLEILLGDHANSWRIGLVATDRGFLLALLPAGALIATGLIIAAKNYFSNPVPPNRAAPVTTRRVRVTGPVS